MPTLSDRLKAIHYYAFCRQHAINPFTRDNAMSSVDRYLLLLFERFERDNPRNDLGVSKGDPEWQNYISAVMRCTTGSGFSDRNVDSLLRAVRELGGDKIAFSATFSMDSSKCVWGHLKM